MTRPRSMKPLEAPEVAAALEVEARATYQAIPYAERIVREESAA